jgi:hypothetical protein
MAFRHPADAERGSLPVEAALREYLRSHRQPGPERSGWRLMGSTNEAAEFLKGDLGDESSEQIRFKLLDGEWVPNYLQHPCALRVWRHGRVAIDWALASDHQPGASARTITVYLQGGECASGMPEKPRLERPVFRRENGVLLMALWLRPLPPGWYGCQAISEPPVTIRLPGRLGSDNLMNGGYFPPRSPIEP